MGVDFTLRENSALQRLLAESATDIILKTDRKGFILQASPSIERWGLPLPGTLIGSHILHLVHPSRAAVVKAEHEAVIAGRREAKWIEFPALTTDDRERWFEIQMRCLMDEEGDVYGAVSIMRSIEERRGFEETLFAAEMTDQLTGLTNRMAFISMLQHLVDKQIGGCLAMFDIDHFKAINMMYGQSVGDEVLVVFSDLLRTMMRSDDIISRIGGQSLGVLLPRTTPDQAEEISQRIIAALSEIRQTASTGSFSITTSAGVSRIGETLDSTIKGAELALFLAKAKGRNRVEMDNGTSLPWEAYSRHR